jgi:hypothetical protein
VVVRVRLLETGNESVIIQTILEILRLAGQLEPGFCLSAQTGQPEPRNSSGSHVYLASRGQGTPAKIQIVARPIQGSPKQVAQFRLTGLRSGRPT